MEDALVDQAAAIRSRADFVEFVRELSANFIEHPEIWANDRLDVFLSAMAAWVEDSDGYFASTRQSVPVSLDWKHIAEMLLAASIYE